MMFIKAGDSTIDIETIFISFFINFDAGTSNDGVAYLLAP